MFLQEVGETCRRALTRGRSSKPSLVRFDASRKAHTHRRCRCYATRFCMRHVLCLLVDRFACERMSLRGHGRFAREHALHCIAAVGQVDPLTDDDLRTTVRHVKRPTAGGLVGTAPELLGSALSSASSPVLARADEKDGLPQHSQPRSALGTLGKLEPIRANVARAGKLGSVEPLGTAGTLSLALQALDSTRPLPSGCRVGPSGDGSCEALGGCRRWRSAPSTCVRASTVECLEGGVRPSRRTISAEVSADAETCHAGTRVLSKPPSDASRALAACTLSVAQCAHAVSPR